jgi:hypothetical protein
VGTLCVMHKCVKKHRNTPVPNFSYVGIRDPPVPNFSYVRIREPSVLSFLERLQPITAAMCTVVINVLEPGAFNPESQ